MCIPLLLLVLLCLALPGLASAAPADIDLTMRDYTATNIPAVEKCLQGTSLIFDTKDATPPGAAYYFVRYRFTIPAGGSGWYSLALRPGRGPGAIGHSRFSWVVDDGEVYAALRTQRILPDAPGTGEQVQPPIRLTPGEHTLEFRFSPDQRLRVMNRATEVFEKYHTELHGAGWRPVDAPAPVAHQALSTHFRLRSHEVIVLFGDSITEEEAYGRHFARIINRVFPDCGITVYNSGVSLNRTPEGLARLDKDVLSLSPDWTVLAFGVNDAMQISLEDYVRNSTEMVTRLQAKGVHVVCASPTGMMPDLERYGETIFSMHASDRAAAIDRSMAANTRGLREVARAHKALFADVYGAFTRTAIPRITLMGNQWHPNEEGGRMFAVTLLRTLGMSEEEITRTGDARDLACYRALAAMAPEPAPPALTPKTPAAPLHGTVIFAAAYGDNRLLACDPQGKLLAMLPTAHHPSALAYSAQRKELFVACEGNGHILIYSLPDLHAAGEIDLGLEAYPIGLALSPDDKTLWVASFFGSKIIELDTATRKPRREIHLPDIVNGLALAPDGNTLLVPLPGKLAFVDLARGEVSSVVATVKFTAAPLRTPDGKLALLDAEHWQLLPVELAAGKLGAPIPAPAQTRALAFDPATGHLFAGDWLNCRLLELDGPRCLRATPLPMPVMALCVAQVE